MIRYEKCCCCFSVRTGALILAILGVTGAGISIISNSVGKYYIRRGVFSDPNASMFYEKCLKCPILPYSSCVVITSSVVNLADDC